MVLLARQAVGRDHEEKLGTTNKTEEKEIVYSLLTARAGSTNGFCPSPKKKKNGVGEKQGEKNGGGL